MSTSGPTDQSGQIDLFGTPLIASSTITNANIGDCVDDTAIAFYDPIGNAKYDPYRYGVGYAATEPPRDPYTTDPSVVEEYLKESFGFYELEKDVEVLDARVEELLEGPTMSVTVKWPEEEQVVFTTDGLNVHLPRLLESIRMARLRLKPKLQLQEPFRTLIVERAKRRIAPEPEKAPEPSWPQTQMQGMSPYQSITTTDCYGVQQSPTTTTGLWGKVGNWFKPL